MNRNYFETALLSYANGKFWCYLGKKRKFSKSKKFEEKKKFFWCFNGKGTKTETEKKNLKIFAQKKKG